MPNLRRTVALLSIEKQANVNAEENTGWTPLIHVCEKGMESVGLLLIEKQADVSDVNAEKDDDWTPLHYSCGRGLKSVAVTLIEKQADINAKDAYRGSESRVLNKTSNKL